MSAAPVALRPLVLVIEDEAPIRKFLRTGLENQRFQPVESCTGLDGVAQAATRARAGPHILLTEPGVGYRLRAD